MPIGPRKAFTRMDKAPPPREFNGRRYLMEEELSSFKLILARGNLSIFRVVGCHKCRQSIPSGFDFCSAKCAGKEEGAKK